MAEATAKCNVILKTYSGNEADTLLAQAEGYRRICKEILIGNADADPSAFFSTCKHISQQQAEKGA